MTATFTIISEGTGDAPPPAYGYTCDGDVLQRYDYESTDCTGSRSPSTDIPTVTTECTGLTYAGASVKLTSCADGVWTADAWSNADCSGSPLSAEQGGEGTGEYGKCCPTGYGDGGTCRYLSYPPPAAADDVCDCSSVATAAS